MFRRVCDFFLLLTGLAASQHSSLAEHALEQKHRFIILHSTPPHNWRNIHQHRYTSSSSSSYIVQEQHIMFIINILQQVSYPAGPWFIFHSTIDIFCSNIIKTWIVAMKLSFRVDHLEHYEGGNPFSNLDHYIFVDGICHHFKILCISVKYFQNKAQIIKQKDKVALYMQRLNAEQKNH